MCVKIRTASPLPIAPPPALFHMDLFLWGHNFLFLGVEIEKYWRLTLFCLSVPIWGVGKQQSLGENIENYWRCFYQFHRQIPNFFLVIVKTHLTFV